MIYEFEYVDLGSVRPKFEMMSASLGLDFEGVVGFRRISEFK